MKTIEEPFHPPPATLIRRLWVTAAFALLPLLAMVVAQSFWRFGFQALTRDVAAIANLHPLHGALSSVGVLLWWTSACVWGFAAALRRRVDDRSPIGFFLHSALLSAYLTADDLFQIHEHLAPKHLNVPEWAVLGALGVALLEYLHRYRHRWAHRDAWLLGVSLVCLGLSAVADLLIDPFGPGPRDWTFLVEDGLKWAGICFWASFAVAYCLDDARGKRPPGRPLTA